MTKFYREHKAIVFYITLGVSIATWAMATFVTKDAWNSVDKRLERIENCMILKECKKDLGAK